MSREEYKSSVEGCFQQYPQAGWVDLKEYIDRSEEEGWVVLDVRGIEERKVSIIPGALGIEEFTERIREFKNSPILVYCTAGCRSGARSEKLRTDGFKAHNLRGGIISWAMEGQPLVTPEGEVSHRVHVFLEKWVVSSDEFECIW